MTKADYTQLDGQILALLRESNRSLNSLQLDSTLIDACRASGAQYGHDGEWRVIDRRLQYLRKKGLIRSVRGKIGPEWELVRRALNDFDVWNDVAGYTPQALRDYGAARDAAKMVPGGWSSALEKCRDAAIESGAYSSYKAVRQAFDELRTMLASSTQPVGEFCTDYHCPGDCGLEGSGYQHTRPPVGEVPMPQDYAERPSDYTGGIWLESQMRQYGDACHAAGYARGLTAATMTQAATDVLAERQRQISAEGWTPEHDDAHICGSIAAAAACYAAPAGNEREAILPYWPWNTSSWKPKSRRSDLVKAGALILAEIERLDRAALRGGVKP